MQLLQANVVQQFWFLNLIGPSQPHTEIFPLSPFEVQVHNLIIYLSLFGLIHPVLWPTQRQTLV